MSDKADPFNVHTEGLITAMKATVREYSERNGFQPVDLAALNAANPDFFADMAQTVLCHGLNFFPADTYEDGETQPALLQVA